jgi:hypothetical protein
MELKAGQLIAIIRDVAAVDVVEIGEALLAGGIDHVEVSLSSPARKAWSASGICAPPMGGLFAVGSRYGHF